MKDMLVVVSDRSNGEELTFRGEYRLRLIARSRMEEE